MANVIRGVSNTRADGKVNRGILKLPGKSRNLLSAETYEASLEDDVEQLYAPPGNGGKSALGIQPDRLLRLKQVLEIVPVSKSTWWSWVANGKAVQPIRLNRCTCWRYSEIMDFIAKKEV